MYLLVLIFPFLGFIFCSIFGSIIGVVGSNLISSLFILLGFCTSLLISFEVFINHSIIFLGLFSWFDLGLLSSNFGLQFDSLVSVMLVLITLVSFFVHIYSFSYMKEDPHLPSFMSYLSLFTFFMILLVTSNNLIQLFIGWEGVGLCSYLLINFWYTSIQANKSAINAMVINKVGDIGLILGIFSLCLVYGSVNYSSLFSLHLVSISSNLSNLIAILILIGAVGNSAQVGLHMWLPDAMEGPTPVSALIHAATMVTAGIFLIISVSPLFESVPAVLSLIIFLGSITAFFSASIGLLQFDIKNIIAYSTCSQLGYMMVICGFSYYNVGLFHLFNHGFFNALLFLSAGMIIHALNDEQDISSMGGLKNYLPLSLIYILIGSMSLMGLPYLTGFYSNDLIIELMYSSHYLFYALLLTLLAISFTSFYSLSLIYYVFFNTPQNYKFSLELSNESSYYQIFPLMFLSLLSISIGYITQFMLLGDETSVMVSNMVNWMPLELSLLGIFLVVVISDCSLDFLNYINNDLVYIYYSFINQAWYFDFIVNSYLINPFLNLGFDITYNLIDNQLLENLGPSSSFILFTSLSQISSYIHSGRTSLYAFYFVVAMVIMLNKS